jgi:hypothetical protein
MGAGVGLEPAGAPTVQAAFSQSADRHSVRLGGGGGWGTLPADAHLERAKTGHPG